MPSKSRGRRRDVEPLYRPEELKHVAPPHPYWFKCPDCAVEKYDVWLIFKYSLDEQWGCVVTRHDFYRCRQCKETYVSTNGSEPDVAADEYKVGRRS